MPLKKITTGVLLAFVLVSIGYAIGKEVTLRSVRAREPAAPPIGVPPGAPALTPAQADTIVVYYLHGTIRCKTCNRIEATARAVLDREFADDLRAGRLLWKTDNYLENEALGRRYDLSTSSVVLAAIHGDTELRHIRLDDVWTHAADPAALDTYLHGAIADFIRTTRRAAP